MPHTWDQKTENAIREVLKRSVTDADYRATAVKDGNAVLAELLGSPLPAGSSITFVDNTGDGAKVVVLPDPVADTEQLTDEELEQVAGGMRACGVSSCGTSS